MTGTPAAARDGLAGRVALVTGGSGGIGQAVARQLAAAGAAVAVGYGHGREAAERVAAQITGAVGRAAALGADLGRADGPGRLLAAAEDVLGPVGILVSNAGLGRRQRLDEVTAADFDEMIAVNLRARSCWPSAPCRRWPHAASAGSCSSPRWPPSPAGSSARTTPPRRPGCTG